MPTIWISAEARQLIKHCALPGHSIKEPKQVLPNGSAYVEVEYDTLINLERTMLLGEDYSGCIIRLCRTYLGHKPN